MAHCPGCHSAVEADWIACPRCGESLSDRQRMNVQDSVVMGDIIQQSNDPSTISKAVARGVSCPTCKTTNVTIFECRSVDCNVLFCGECHPESRFNESTGLGRVDSPSKSSADSFFCKACIALLVQEWTVKKLQEAEKEKEAKEKEAEEKREARGKEVEIEREREREFVENEMRKYYGKLLSSPPLFLGLDAERKLDRIANHWNPHFSGLISEIRKLPEVASDSGGRYLDDQLHDILYRGISGYPRNCDELVLPGFSDLGYRRGGMFLHIGGYKIQGIGEVEYPRSAEELYDHYFLWRILKPDELDEGRPDRIEGTKNEIIIQDEKKKTRELDGDATGYMLAAYLSVLLFPFGLHRFVLSRISGIIYPILFVVSLYYERDEEFGFVFLLMSILVLCDLFLIPKWSREKALYMRESGKKPILMRLLP